MKNKLFFIAAMALSGVLMLANTRRDPNNPPTGRTGAPGETTCGATNCHSGGTFTGTIGLSGIPDTVTPGTSYSVTITNTTDAVRAGYELTCLTGSNAMCGTLVAGTGSSIGSGTGGKKYARQSSPKTLSNGSTSWTFTWKAPTAAPAADTATFYFVSLCANGNGQKTGDNPIAGTKRIVFATTTPVTEPGQSIAVSMYPTIVTEGLLNVELATSGTGRITVFDGAGKALVSEPLSSENRIDVSALTTGIYFAHISVEGATTVKKLIVK